VAQAVGDVAGRDDVARRSAERTLDEAIARMLVTGP
jgi:hypothetical protein